jgi:hypothetical protein
MVPQKIDDRVIHGKGLTKVVFPRVTRRPFS